MIVASVSGLKRRSEAGCRVFAAAVCNCTLHFYVPRQRSGHRQAASLVAGTISLKNRTASRNVRLVHWRLAKYKKPW